ncbi:MAG: hypothetical protein EOO15_03590 [Chitinophagaceae bacterium]|nr:MAG: hypothetical protein EOO15_03590 [Chitinophagaceae bacterium]
MRILLSGLLFLALLPACKKSSTDTNNNNNNTTITDGWKLGTATHTTEMTQRPSGSTAGFATIGLMAMQGFTPTTSPDNITAYFATYPTTSGTYRVVAFPGTGALAAGETYVIASGPGTGSYGSTGAGTVDVTVTVNASGKATIVIPDITLRKLSGTEELVAGGTIRER